jgi:hypothetical protein
VGRQRLDRGCQPASDVGVNQLAGVAAISSKDAVAVGWAQGSASVYRVLILKWNGTKWSIA